MGKRNLQTQVCSAEQRLAALQRQVVAAGVAGVSGAADSFLHTSSGRRTSSVRLHYRVTGPHSAPTMVFVAGVVLCCLCQTGHECIGIMGVCAEVFVW